jgi:hypothetical protein
MTWGATSAGWTRERRQKQSEAIQEWKPWEKSTGSKSDAGVRRQCTPSAPVGQFNLIA